MNVRNYKPVAAAAVSLMLVMFVGLQASASRRMDTNVELALQLPAKAMLSAVADSVPGLAPEATTITVRPGDSLARIFSRVGLTPADVHAVVHSSVDARRLVDLKPNQVLSFVRDVDGKLVRVEYPLDEARILKVARVGENYRSEVTELPIERRVRFAEGTISSSLFLAARDAGLSDALTMNLARIFGWDIDFVLDIRAGDRFTVLFEEIYRDGEKLRDGNILAAEFVNRGNRYKAVRFNDDYFTPEGLAMRKAFLRAPVDFTRISSNFNPNRRHPILNRIRAHRGVDYAAPTGTRIYAAGDGRVVFRGNRNGTGNTVELQHGGNITTLYAHMSRFASGVTTGSRVRQGQLIGYVGMTGLATGPHLHYEFRLNGVHRNPVTVKLPDAAPLPAEHHARFATYATPLLAHLQVLSIEGRQFAIGQPADAG
ncbi:MAG: peptidoglycan DD-metalloendopeptidase family protein [Gammaproteobacteria bacterium]